MWVAVSLIALLSTTVPGSESDLRISAPGVVQFVVESDSARVMEYVSAGIPWPGTPFLVATSGEATVSWASLESYTRTGLACSVSAAVETPVAAVAGEGFFRAQHVTRVVVQPLQKGKLGWVFYPKVQVTVKFPSSSSFVRTETDPFGDKVLYPLLVNGDQARFLKGRSPSTPRSIWPPPTPSCKIVVDHQGLFKITYEAFLANGVELEAVDTATFCLWYHGEEQAFLVEDGGDGDFGAGDYMVFFGNQRHREDPAGREAAYESYYTREATYWFSWDGSAGKRWTETDGTPNYSDPEAVWYWEMTHAEEENTIFIAYHNEALNNELEWYWFRLNAGNTLRQFSVSTDAVAQADSFVLRMGIQGGSEGAEHHSEFYAGGSLVDSSWWGDTGGRVPLLFDSADSGLGSSLTLDLLSDPTTSIGLKELPDALPGSGAYSFLNWIEIEYPRFYVTRDSALAFRGPDGSSGETYLFRVREFDNDDVAVVNLTDSLWITGATILGDTLLFSCAASSSDLFWVQHLSTIDTVISVIPYTPPDPPLDSPNRQADYIAIAHPLFYTLADSLAEEMALEFGWTKATIDVTDIYDYFSYGEMHPTAIRDFLVAAYEGWEAPLISHVVLVGDASWDFLGYTRPETEVNYVPTWGNPGNDYYYSALTHNEQDEYDWIPDIATGRLPARTEEEARTMIRRILDCLDTPSFSKRLLFVAHGSNDWENLSFAYLSDNLIDSSIPEELLAVFDTVYGDAEGAPGARSYKDDFAGSWKRAPLIIHYIGRGGHYTWSMEYHVSMADTLTGDAPNPFLIGGSCNSGRFALPDSSCLAEAGIRATALGAGPVGIISSTGITSTSQAHLWAQFGLPRLLAEDPRYSVGESNLSGILMSGEFLSERYMLIGDPGVVLARPLAPDLSTSEGWLSVDPGEPSEDDVSITLSMAVVNNGCSAESAQESCWVSLSDSSSYGQSELSSIMTRLPVQRDTVLSVSWDPIPSRGGHQLKAVLDRGDEVQETNEDNNSSNQDIFVFFSAPVAVAPKDGALLVDQAVQLVVRSLPDEEAVQYRFQTCEDPRFDPFGDVLESGLISAGEYYTLWSPPALEEGVVHYWRCRAEDGTVVGKWSDIRSLQTDLQAVSGGWRQAHWGQFEVDSLFSCRVDSLGSRVLLSWDAGSDVALVDSGAGVVSVSSSHPSFSPDNLIGPDKFIFGNNDMDQTATIDLGKTRWLVALGSELWAGPMDRGVWSQLELATSMDGVNFGEIWISYGTYEQPNLEIPARTYVSIDDPIEVRYIRARFGAGCPHPDAYWGSRIYEITAYPLLLAPQGNIVGQVVGPAARWVKLSVDATLPEAADSILISVSGYSTMSSTWEEVAGLQDLTAPLTLDIGFVDPELYPWVELSARFVSSAERGGPALTSWEILHTPR